MIRINIRTIIRSLLTVLAFLLCSCEPEDIPMVVDAGGGDRLSISLDLGTLVDTGGGTKVSLLDGVEDRFSGAQVLVFQDGLLTTAMDVSASDFTGPLTAVKTLSVRRGVSLTLLVTGNLWAVDKASPASRKHLLRAMDTAFPTRLSDVRALPFRLDGSDIPGASGYRYETFSEVASLGIPFSGETTLTVSEDGQTVSIPCRRLFARVNVTVDHSGLVGPSENASWFRNSKLYLRGASAVLRPFDNAGTMKVTSTSDILAESDYDAAMTNGGKLTFAFYVPENVHGTVPLPSNTDPTAKTYDNLSSYEYRDCLTYVEFTGLVDSGAGGYSGTYTYRFYVGADNTKDFSVERNRLYDITLKFNVNSLFDPGWRVGDGGTLSDGRRFCLTADVAGTTALPDGQLVAVRGNRPGTVYVYMNRKGALGENHMKGHGVVDAAFVPAGLSDCGWCGDFLSSAGVCTDPTLTSWGITPAYDPATGALTFSVTDPVKYASHIGGEADLTLRLLPGDREVTMKVKLYPDLSAAPVAGTLDGDDFFVGMKRSVRLSGYVSPTVQVRNSASGVTSYNTVKLQSEGGSRQFLGASAVGVPSDRDLHIYGYADNGKVGCACTLEIVSSDPFNDGPAVYCTVMARSPSIKIDGIDPEFLLPRTVPSKGWIRKAVDKGELNESLLASRDYVVLYVHGDECSVTPAYYSDDTRTTLIPRGAFDEETYQEIMKPALYLASKDEFKPWYGSRMKTAGGAPVIDTNGYEVYEVFFSAGGNMTLYNPDGTYETAFYSSSIGADFISPYVGLVVPAVYSDRLMLSRVEFNLHDYSLADASALRSDLKAATTITDPNAKTNYYGARRPEDVDFFFKPKLEGIGKSFANHCLHGSLDQLEDGQITFKFEDPDITDADIKHSVGEHEIYPSIVNKHNGFRINAASPIQNFIINVFVHLPFGTEISMARYNTGIDDIVETRFTTRPAFVTDKCSVVDTYEKYEGAPICYPYKVPDVDSGALLMTFENYTYSDAGRTLQYVMKNPDDAVPAMAMKMMVNRSWHDMGEQHSAGAMLDGYCDERTMLFFHSLFPNPDSDLEFYDTSISSSAAPRPMQIYGLSHYLYGGYYVADRLQDICPSSGGWINQYEGTRFELVYE